MRSKHLNAETLLRSLIREYKVQYGALSSLYTQDLQGVSLPKLGSGVKTLGAFLLGLAALKGYSFVSKNKGAILSFADNIKNLPDTLEDLKDMVDLITNESRVRRKRLIESESTFDTEYGDITTIKLDKVIIKNLYNAESNRYITVPSTITSKNSSELKALLDPIVSPVRSKVSRLTSIVTSSQKNFPADFSDFSSTFEDVDEIDDLDDKEKVAANNAISDGVATAIYNSIKTQMQMFIEEVADYIDEKTKGNVIDESESENMNKTLEDFAVEIAKAMEVTGKARSILVG